MNLNLLDLQRHLQKNGVLITFSGRFTQEIIEELGDAVKKYMETESTQHKTHDVFAVFIEQTQNVKNYASSQSEFANGEKIANSGIVAIGKDAEGYFVSSGNMLTTTDVELLKDKLAVITSLDKIGLKKLYKEQIKKTLDPESTGAGLGLIDMARRASGKLQYSIQDIDEQLSFFTLKVQV
ncbi:MAG: hypothetical protein K0Q53_423 [Massilibacillus sp.]|jgi:hypothetical protein|nr:hypothetical protein [Massilibacillus sp.]